MFKALTLFRYKTDNDADLPLGNLEVFEFTPCTPSQKASMGFVPPRAAHGALHERQGQHLMLHVCVETRTVPPASIKLRTDELKAKVHDETGRKPGKKESRDLRDQAAQELQPKAFSKFLRIPVWIDTERHLVAVGSVSGPRCDAVVSMLVQALDGLMVQLWTTNTAPSVAMGLNLRDEINTLSDGDPFVMGRECELVLESAKLTYKNLAVETVEIADHIKRGMHAVSLQLEWDERLSFTLAGVDRIKKIQFMDAALEGRSRDEDRFDGDFAIATGTIGGMIDALVDALDGYKPDQEETEDDDLF